MTADWQRSAGLLEISDPSVSVGSVAVYRQLLAVPVPRQLVPAGAELESPAPYEWAGLI